MAVTRRECVAELQENCGVALTIRGIFVPPKETPPEGERKLHLFIESGKQANITKVLAEIKAVLRTEIRRELTEFKPRNRGPGRYQVLAIKN